MLIVKIDTQTPDSKPEVGDKLVFSSHHYFKGLTSHMGMLLSKHVGPVKPIPRLISYFFPSR
jgi:hypothetical protein